MLFRLSVVRSNPADEASGWMVTITDPSGAVLSNQPLGRTPDGFPLPPAGEAGMPAGLSSAGIGDLYTNLMNQAGITGSVELFGSYLFNCLLGPAWALIDAAAGTNPVELALTWEAADLALNRLPWEALNTAGHPGDFRGFLAGQPDVAITRRVAGSTTTLTGQKLPSPPKVLFVIGVPLSDPVIRPGAEYLGLLKSLDTNGLSLHHRLLLDATLDSLQLAIDSFRPNIVHIISHGLQSGGKTVLKFIKKAGSNETIEIDAENLLNALSLDQKIALPAVLVLNACSTGASLSDEMTTSRPLAAELIQRGIPVVVGMSGQVADQACRLFTKGFYQALLSQEDGAVALAAARGRRAAIAHGGYSPTSVLDWALPTLYLSAALGEASLDLEQADFEMEAQRFSRDFLLGEDYPVFCGRWDVIRQYLRLVSDKNKDIQFLAIAIPRRDQSNQVEALPQFGRSRLLKELAAQALRDGHVPILVTKNDSSGLKKKSWPVTLDEFLGQDLLPAGLHTLNTLQKFSIHQDLSWGWNYLPRFIQLPPGSPLPADFPAEFTQFATATHEQKRAMAFRADLVRLVDEVRQQRQDRLGLSDAERDRILLILLIDDLHQMNAYHADVLAMLDQFGLRKARTKIRVIFTYSTEALAEQAFAVDAIKSFQNSYDVEEAILKAFHDLINPANPQATALELEKAALVYKNFLLNWRYKGQKIPLALTRSRYKKDPPTPVLFAALARLVQGYPSNLTLDTVSEKIYTFAFEMEEQSYLKPADDEAAIAELGQYPTVRGS